MNYNVYLPMRLLQLASEAGLRPLLAVGLGHFKASCLD